MATASPQCRLKLLANDGITVLAYYPCLCPRVVVNSEHKFFAMTCPHTTETSRLFCRRCFLSMTQFDCCCHAYASWSRHEVRLREVTRTGEQCHCFSCYICRSIKQGKLVVPYDNVECICHVCVPFEPLRCPEVRLVCSDEPDETETYLAIKSVSDPGVIQPPIVGHSQPYELWKQPVAFPPEGVDSTIDRELLKWYGFPEDYVFHVKHG
jgi:hypothetical protein